jgi:hypothetical protein
MNGSLKVFPACVPQRCLQVAGKPELYAFGISALHGIFKIALESLKLFIHGIVLSE